MPKPAFSIYDFKKLQQVMSNLRGAGYGQGRNQAQQAVFDAKKAQKSSRKTISATSTVKAKAASQTATRSAYNTTGTYQGKFPKGKKQVIKKGSQVDFSKTGSIKKIELGASVSSAQCVYLGHSFSILETGYAAYRAILTDLYRMAKNPILNWSDIVEDTGQIRINYIENSATATNQVLVVSIAGREDGSSDSFNQLVINLENNLRVVLSDTPIIFVSFELLVKDEALVDQYNTVAKIRCDDYKLFFNLSSSLTFQNVTNAITPTAGDAEADVGNVAANPITGRVYSNQAKGGTWQNGFAQKQRRIIAATGATLSANNTFFGHKVTGIISADGQNLNGDFLKPPMPYTLTGAVVSAVVNMEPGAMKKDYLKFTCSMHWNTFFEKYSVEQFNDTYRTATSQFPPSNFGWARMYSMEPKLDSRVGSNSVNLEYQLEQVYAAKGQYIQNTRQAPIISVL